MIIILLFFVAFFFAINIGASGAAASMGIAYGSKAVSNRKMALLICGIGVFLGAILGGGEVVKTLGSEIVPDHMISIKIALIILSSASISLFIANLSGIPLSTSEVTVGAVVGVGIAFQVLYVNTLLMIVLFWLFVPFIAFLLAFITNKGIQRLQPTLQGKSTKLLAIAVILTGFLEAFSAGMNNVANSVGPLVAAGLLSIEQGTFYGGIFVALGAIFLGGKVIETNGKKITKLTLLQGGAVSGIGATLVIIASIFGIPVPHTQITTCSILGVGVSAHGKALFKKSIITKLVKTWVLSPFFSLILSYNLVKIFIRDDYSGLTMIFILVAIIYAVGIWQRGFKSRPLYKEKVVPKKLGGS
ncbi:inorganic phosphate transporter [Ornithinibacillus sp. L9]|uniref:Inorganic phosphate transporter n=1 Tax=Ornithinibacillus caprae TaxID=2678566 RepID=A0A6N8FP74_9BACI|nr:inorganic phosphate transporter [Ornithinibacillus caprae]MUK90394.1 inorganic phosphate transporter [Ornithinibacillus caprae]